MMEEIYRENILDHYKNPRNKKALHNCTSAKETNPSCGDELTLYLNLQNGKISEASFTGIGCAISQASASMLTEKLAGMDAEAAKKLDEKSVLEMLGISISVNRMNCAILPLKALRKCL